MSSSSRSSLSLSPWGILRDDLVEIPILAVAIDRECVQFQHTGGLLKLGQELAGLCWRMVGIGALLRRIRDEHLHEEPSGCPCLCWRMVGIGALPLRMRRSHEGAGVREIPSSSPFSLSESEPLAMQSMASR